MNVEHSIQRKYILKIVEIFCGMLFWCPKKGAFFSFSPILTGSNLFEGLAVELWWRPSFGLLLSHHTLMLRCVLFLEIRMITKV